MPTVPSYYGIPFAHSAPPPIKLSDVFDSYEEFDLPFITGKGPEASRLANLRLWFGELTLGELNKAFLTRWQADRFAGKFGSGRDSTRAATMAEFKAKADNGEVQLTKQQRHCLKKRGENVPEAPIPPVSSQTVRHELAPLRRTITRYVLDDRRKPMYEAMWKLHYPYDVDLADAADARERQAAIAAMEEVLGTPQSCVAHLFHVMIKPRRPPKFWSA